MKHGEPVYVWPKYHWSLPSLWMSETSLPCPTLIYSPTAPWRPPIMVGSTQTVRQSMWKKFSSISTTEHHLVNIVISGKISTRKRGRSLSFDGWSKISLLALKQIRSEMTMDRFQKKERKKKASTCLHQKDRESMRRAEASNRTRHEGSYDRNWLKSINLIGNLFEKRKPPKSDPQQP